MARRRAKKRTHIGANNPNKPQIGHATVKDPKSMVVRIGAGEVGSSVSQLSTDVRRVMEPGTASRLKERRGNKLRDYATMAGPLGVTHFLLFSRSESGNTNLRIALTPRGPTLNFRVESYSLCKDIRKSQRRPKGGGKEYITPPLLVMNNFSSSTSGPSKVPRHLESLTTTVFQSLFPPINPQTTPLKSIRRVLLLNREQSSDKDGRFVLNFRHYAITTKRTGISKPLSRLNAAETLAATSKHGRKHTVPNLGGLEDIADYMIGGEDGGGYVTDGGTSGSEADTDAEVEILDVKSRKVASAGSKAAKDGQNEPTRKATPAPTLSEGGENVERRAVKLTELGPRMRLRLTKVEEGLCSGKVMWHEYIHKTREEEKEMEARWEERGIAKEARRKEQKANVERKRKEKEAKQKDKGAGSASKGEDDERDEYDDIEYEDWDSEGLGGDGELEVNEEMEVDG